MAVHRYKPVGHCIYCGETKPPASGRFGDEHIIALGFGGNLVLPEASCKTCERTINREIETPILRHEWGAIRDKRAFPTRDRKAQKNRTHLAVDGANGERLNIPILDHSTPVPLYHFREPRILTGMPRGNDNMHFTASILMDKEAEVAMQRKYPNWNKTHRFRARPHIYARMLAKIGYAYAVAEYGGSSTDAFTSLVTDLVLGRSDDWTLTVGGWWDIPAPIPGGDHLTDISVVQAALDRSYLIVDVRLFSQLETPKYRVVVGEIRYNNSRHVAAFEKHRQDGRVF